MHCILLLFLLLTAMMTGGHPVLAEGLKVVVTDDEGACPGDVRTQDIERLRTQQLGLAREMLAMLAKMQRAADEAGGAKEQGREIPRMRSQAERIVKELEGLAATAATGRER